MENVDAIGSQFRNLDWVLPFNLDLCPPKRMHLRQLGPHLIEVDALLKSQPVLFTTPPGICHYDPRTYDQKYKDNAPELVLEAKELKHLLQTAVELDKKLRAGISSPLMSKRSNFKKILSSAGISVRFADSGDEPYGSRKKGRWLSYGDKILIL